MSHVLYALDLPTLLVLRRVCRTWEDSVSEHLLMALSALLQDLVPNPRAFLSSLTFARGFIVGSTAVAFLLRRSSSFGKAVDVVLPRDSSVTAFVFHLMMEQGARLRYQRIGANRQSRSRRAVAVTCHLLTSKGWIYVHQSTSRFALLPIVMSTLSLQLSYVNMHHFGTAYPNLLFDRRALLANLSASKSAVVAAYLERGFSIRLYSNHWPDHDDEGQCAAEFFECPAQVRTFSDEVTVVFTFVHHDVETP
ncbi:uncharacterized protein TRAVEDRAFT_50893 [Trametes versicolor FP-101664 SS1]|uniref:uncharacterized protein n=1 Tax=Trametes versicolor (strain FP-101664) TaxID=717944 RepID=UPI0004622376|nr:uncharacterized protein TRAVEDRAFT_50893 [Trametes versicolor FP-101664 SS1]EIW54755.1 hypothetical protein TRAVEDRAFT_50893 [Trametes versicolor FP-101664 SS1]